MTTYLFEIRATDKGMKVEYPTKFDNYPATNFTELVALCAAVELRLLGHVRHTAESLCHLAKRDQ